MAETKRRRKSKPAAAVAEKTDDGAEGLTIVWRGHTFKLPPKLPPSLMFRLADLQESNSPIPMLALLKNLLDSGEEGQYSAVIREIDAASEDKVQEVTESAYALLYDAMGEISGTDEGESEASQDS